MDIKRIWLGMAIQAITAGTLNAAGLITLSTGQQISAGLFCLCVVAIAEIKDMVQSHNKDLDKFVKAFVEEKKKTESKIKVGDAPERAQLFIDLENKNR